ncbi:hypothetical protein [Urbifossiella limnaea]|uniref:Uncharacterized protein n=1 Tax=Urbifossiella limnaea TaxID=2528023 RepID=A0A517Y242_9BACT|nr:hypothetical protein [Urbifossiella limnaea]QDU23768.1 hypothetical protein ETAA1_57750 [Urbifossiella limnaea]
MTEAAATPTTAVASLTFPEIVARVIKTAQQPVAIADIKKTLKAQGVAIGGKKGHSDSDIEAAVTAEVGGGTAFAHPATSAKGKPRFWHTRPKTAAEVVADALREKVRLLGTDEVVTDKQLGRPGGKKATPEATAAFDGLLAEMQATGQLFRRGKGYARTAPPPPKWYETDPGKKPFDALVKAAQKVTALGVAPLDDLFTILRSKLESAPTPRPAPVVTAAPPAPVTPPPAPAVDLPAVLKLAYEHLCLFVEFRDRLVELPRLYHEAAKRLPGLTVEDFHHELWRLSEARAVQLHVLNEVRGASEPHLAIHRNDRLYYFVRWN